MTNRGKPVFEVRPCRGVEHKPVDVLRGSMVRYENPTELVAENSWTSSSHQQSKAKESAYVHAGTIRQIGKPCSA
ncbi:MULTISPECIES: hypothetical protein [Paraburkholderia]|uniref:hypothetical protein n=1 Tax=Paraburkholderia TaxID=1822464 RepID=UPI0038B7C844